MNKKQILILSVLFLAVLLIIAACFVFPTSAKSENRFPSIEDGCLKSYEIQPNESLWSIGEKFADGFGISVSEYVAELKEMNHLTSDRIFSGDNIIIVYAKNASEK